MSKPKLTVMVVGSLMVIVCGSLLFFMNKSKDLTRKLSDSSARLEEIRPGYQKLSQEESGLKEKADQLFKENEAIKVDRQNLMEQIKTLLQERSKASELGAALEKASSDLIALGKEKKELQDYNLAQKDEIVREKN